jgi:hypothetical protein
MASQTEAWVNSRLKLVSSAAQQYGAYDYIAGRYKLKDRDYFLCKILTILKQPQE